MLEKEIETKVVRYAKDHGVVCIKLNGPSHRGLPDRLFIAHGKAYFIEFKTLKGTVTVLQAHIHKQLGNVGFPVTVINDVEAGKVFLRTFLIRRGDERARRL